MPRLCFLEDRIPWFGSFNGYEQLTRYLPAGQPHRIIAPRASWAARLRGKVHSLRHGLGRVSQIQVDATRRFGQAMREDPQAIGHVLYGEHCLPYLHSLPPAVLARTVVTLHQPYAQWQHEGLVAMARLRHVVLLFTPPAGSFERHLPAAPHVIRHGVDTQHFSPGTAARERRVLYSGVHLRNLPMLERVIERLLASDPEVEVDMLVPLAHRRRESFVHLTRLPRLVWHAGLDDAALLALYRRCSAMLLPMADSGANTAVVEALSCGLPVVTTNVGGIADYGGGTVYPVVDADDDTGALALLQRLLDDPVQHAACSARCRSFAVDALSWPRTVAEHLAVYAAVAAAPEPAFTA